MVTFKQEVTKVGTGVHRVVGWESGAGFAVALCVMGLLA